MRRSRVHYLQLHPGLHIPDLKLTDPFRTVVVAELEVSRNWQDDVCCWLVDSGCLYAICWGIDCVVWEDGIDHASITYGERNQTPGDHFLMTTAHADESLADAFWFAENCAFEEYHSLDDVVILHLSKTGSEEFMRSKYIAACERA